MLSLSMMNAPLEKKKYLVNDGVKLRSRLRLALNNKADERLHRFMAYLNIDTKVPLFLISSSLSSRWRVCRFVGTC